MHASWAPKHCRVVGSRENIASPRAGAIVPQGKAMLRSLKARSIERKRCIQSLSDLVGRPVWF